MVFTSGSTIVIESAKATLDDKFLFEAQLSTLLSKGETIIQIDVGATAYLPSEMMGLLMWKKKELLRKGVHLKIIRISSTLKSFFDNMRINEYFEIENAEVIES